MIRAMQGMGRLSNRVVVSAILALSMSNPVVVRAAQPEAFRAPICVSASGVVCFERGSMGERWRALAGVHPLQPVLGPGVLLAGSSSGLHALNLSDGKPLWTWRPGDTVFPPAVDETTVYATDRAGHVAAIRLSDGDIKWRRNLDGWLYTPALSEGLVVTGGRRAAVHALDRQTGRTMWTRELDQELVSPPVAVRGGAVATTFSGSVYKLSLEGHLLWKQVDPVPSFSPAVAGNLLIFGGMDGMLRARGVASGALRWQLELSGPLSIRPSAHAGQIAVATPDGELVIVDSAKGTVLCRRAIRGRPLAAPVALGSQNWRAFHLASGIVSWVDASCS